MRERFIATASDLLDRDERLAVVLADISVASFREAGVAARHPDRVVNVGIREQSLVGFAAGMALEGFRPIVHSYAPFVVSRPFEQVKLDFGHQGLGGIFVSVGASYDASASGRTHHAPEDVALISTLPGWRVHVPGHPDEVETALRAEAVSDGCAYIRLAEAMNREAVSAPPGRLAILRRGHGPTVLAVGPLLDPALAATDGLDPTVLYASTVRPLDAETLRDVAATEVVLVEPYLEGTSAADVTAALRDRPHRLLSIGTRNVEPRNYGTRREHDRAHGLDADGIRARIDAFLAC